MATLQAAGPQDTTLEGRMSESRTGKKDGGATTISDQVVAKIAGIAAREVEGVHELTAQGITGTISGLANKVSGGEGHDTGVKVQVGQQETIVDLAMIVRYGTSIPRVADGVRKSVSDQILSMTGLRAREINIAVTDISFPEKAQAVAHELQ
jgi:uncharacterized alkaline shock family protein YloU